VWGIAPGKTRQHYRGGRAYRGGVSLGHAAAGMEASQADGRASCISIDQSRGEMRVRGEGGGVAFKGVTLRRGVECITDQVWGPLFAFRAEFKGDA
jgi:hypothetical protein